MEGVDFVKSHEGSATYQITVQGKVDSRFMSTLNNLVVSHTKTGRGTLSTLTGEIVDQEALSGILNILFDNQFPVVAVTKIG